MRNNNKLKSICLAIFPLVLACLTCLCILKIFFLQGHLTIDYTIQYALYSLLIIVCAFFAMEKYFKGNWFFLLLIPIAILMTGNWLALTGFVVFMLASMGGGLFIEELLIDRKKHSIVSNTIYALFIGLSVNAFIVYILLHFYVNYTSIYYLFFLSEILIARKALVSFFIMIKSRARNYKFSWGQKTIAIAMLFYIFYALVPIYAYDDLVSHLFICKFTSVHHYWKFTPLFIPALDIAIIPTR